MAVLTDAEKASIAQLIDYLQGNYEKPLDQRVVQTLLPMAEKFGYVGAGTVGLSDALRDAPFSTLLTALLAVAA